MFASKQLWFLVCVLVCSARAFAPTLSSSTRSMTALNAMTTVPPPLPAAVETLVTPDAMTTMSPMQQGVESYLSRSSTMQVALEERKIPTKEEIQAKKNTFNVIFWGGGFVAPFLATIFYFGFRFWEK